MVEGQAENCMTGSGFGGMMGGRRLVLLVLPVRI